MIFLTTGDIIKQRSVGVDSVNASPLECTNCSKYNYKSSLATLKSLQAKHFVLPLPLVA